MVVGLRFLGSTGQRALASMKKHAENSECSLLIRVVDMSRRYELSGASRAPLGSVSPGDAPEPDTREIAFPAFATSYAGTETPTYPSYKSLELPHPLT